MEQLEILDEMATFANGISLSVKKFSHRLREQPGRHHIGSDSDWELAHSRIKKAHSSLENLQANSLNRVSLNQMLDSFVPFHAENEGRVDILAQQLTQFGYRPLATKCDTAQVSVLSGDTAPDWGLSPIKNVPTVIQHNECSPSSFPPRTDGISMSPLIKYSPSNSASAHDLLARGASTENLDGNYILTKPADVCNINQECLKKPSSQIRYLSKVQYDELPDYLTDSVNYEFLNEQIRKLNDSNVKKSASQRIFTKDEITSLVDRGTEVLLLMLKSKVLSVLVLDKQTFYTPM